MAAEIESRLAAGLSELGLALAPAQVEALLTLVTELADWNTRVNLTAIDDPAEVVDKHLLDSLAVLPYLTGLTVADVGSGAGFPGLPIALLHPEIAVTLAESQNKKAAFLREAVRTLELPNVTVWPNRAESLSPDHRFDTVTLRAVDNMPAALAAAIPLAAREILILANSQPDLPPDFVLDSPIPVPGSQHSYLFRASRA